MTSAHLTLIQTRTSIQFGPIRARMAMGSFSLREKERMRGSERCSYADPLTRVILLVVMLWCFVVPLSRAEAALNALLEGPEDGQTVAGVAIIRGWAFSDTAGVTISKVELVIDGTVVSAIACCSSRTDVTASFPQAPVENTTNSGFGLTVNYGLLPPGSHSVQVKITDSSGSEKVLSSTVTVVRAGSSQFLDQVDLSGATAKREGQDVVLTGVRVRDKASQQVTQLNARLRWFKNIQGLGLVEAASTGAATLQTRESRAQSAAEGAQISPIKAKIESPSNGQTVAGIAVIRGWAFSSAGRTIRQIQLLVDGNLFAVVPCCSVRGDVAQGFPNVPEALNSGFGITVNYGGLATGVHTLALKIEDSAGATKTLYKGVVAKRQGEIAFVEQLDLSAANVRIANGALVIDGAKIAGTSRVQRYRFDLSAQAFLLTDESAAEVAIANTSCEVNGNVSSLTALKQNPGSDGISFPEAVEAINRTPSTLDVLLTWQVKGTIACPSLVRLTSSRGFVTIDGDVDGNGSPGVTLDASGGGSSPSLGIFRSYTTLRHLRILSLPILVGRQAIITNIAFIGIEATAGPSPAIRLSTSSIQGQSDSLSDFLIINCHLAADGEVISLAATSDSGSGRGEMRRVTIVENVVVGKNNEPMQGALVVSPTGGHQLVLSQLTIANNTIDSGSEGIRLRTIGTDQVIEATIVENIIRGGSNGIVVIGGLGTKNTTVVDLHDNVINDRLSGISLVGGMFSDSAKNMVTASIAGNEIDGAFTGIDIVGGSFRGSANIQTVQNSVTADVRGNAVVGRFAAIQVQGGLLASGNMTETMIANNTVTSSRVGIEIDGGRAPSTSENQQGASIGNMAMGTIQGNTVQGSANSDIDVFGGIDDSGGTVTGNVAEQRIGNNNARTPTCQNGLAGNIARCTFANASTEAMTTEPREARASTVEAAAVPLLQQLDERISDLRTRAKETTTTESAAELLRLADRLAERRTEIIQRRQEVR